MYERNVCEPILIFKIIIIMLYIPGVILLQWNLYDSFGIQENLAQKFLHQMVGFDTLEILKNT